MPARLTGPRLVVQLSWERWLADGPPLGVLGGGEATEGRVGSVGVVLDAPGFDDDLGFEEGAELLDVEQLVAGPTVEALDEGVLPGRAWLDVGRRRVVEPAPVAQGPGDELGPVVHPQVFGRAAFGDEPFDDGDGVIGGAGGGGVHCEGLAGGVGGGPSPRPPVAGGA